MILIVEYNDVLTNVGAFLVFSILHHVYVYDVCVCVCICVYMCVCLRASHPTAPYQHERFRVIDAGNVCVYVC